MSFIPLFLACLIAEPTACKVIAPLKLMHILSIEECLMLLQIAEPIISGFQEGAGQPVTLEPFCVQRPMGA
jgi:hypothetical protein